MNRVNRKMTIAAPLLAVFIVAAFPQAPNAFDPEKTYPVEALKADLKLRPFLYYWTIETKKDPVMERALQFLERGK